MTFSVSFYIFFPTTDCFKEILIINTGPYCNDRQYSPTNRIFVFIFVVIFVFVFLFIFLFIFVFLGHCASRNRRHWSLLACCLDKLVLLKAAKYLETHCEQPLAFNSSGISWIDTILNPINKGQFLFPGFGVFPSRHKIIWNVDLLLKVCTYIAL